MTLPALSVALVVVAVAIAGAALTSATRRGPRGRRPAHALRALGVALLMLSGFYLGATTTLGAWLGSVAPAAGLR